MERNYEWLIGIAALVRVVALVIAAVLGAILERDVGVLPDAPQGQRSELSSKSSADKAECLPAP